MLTRDQQRKQNCPDDDANHAVLPLASIVGGPWARESMLIHRRFEVSTTSTWRGPYKEIGAGAMGQVDRAIVLGLEPN